MAKLFISFKGEDDTHRNTLEGNLKNPNNSFTHVPVSAREDRRQRGEKHVRDYLKSLIVGCDVVVCLVGINTHQSKWVDYELSVAKSLRKPIVALALPDGRGTGPCPAPIANYVAEPWSDAENAVWRAIHL